MRIEFTVRGPQVERDVAVTADAAVEFATFRASVLTCAGLASDSSVWSGSVALTDLARLGDTGLRTGALLTVDGPSRSESRAGVLSLHVIGGPESGRVMPLERGRLRVGRSSGCDLVLRDDRVSRAHLEIDIAGALTVRDLDSTNGTFIDGVALGRAVRALQVGQLVGLGDSLLVVHGEDDAPAALTPAHGVVLVNRVPRRTGKIPSPVLALPQPRGGDDRPRRVQWVTAALPAVAGGLVAWLADSPQFLLFALLSPVMVLSGALGDRVNWRRSRRRESRRYRVARTEAEAGLAAALAAETADRRSRTPDPAVLWRTATAPGSRLWERRRSDDDNLVLRVGAGDLPSGLLVDEGTTRRCAGRLHAVPLCVDLRAGPIGLTGPVDAIDALSRWLVAQLAVLHSPADVDLALLLSPERAEAWTWARWLPHVGSRVATNRDEWPPLIAAIAGTVEHRRTARRPPAQHWTGRWLVLVVDHAAELADLAALDALLVEGVAFGVAAVCIDSDPGSLPNACVSTLRVGGETGAAVTVRCPGLRSHAITDQVSTVWATQVARALAPLADPTAGDATLPSRCGLLDLLGLPGLLAPDTTDAHNAAVAATADLLTGWDAGEDRLDTVLGRAGDAAVQVDLCADGPHVLIAGTTGAGKSQLLQTLVTGLAIRHPPEHVTFLLVDYKGGAAFAACADLPHTAGLVTDLDPHLTRRALRSLHAELRRRETVLAAAGVPDLAAYRRSATATVLPRLVIVVDEFATLAEELPEFVGGLVAVARRGRSLGVHLVLATQRPGSAVTPDIRANTSLRLALRVTDAGESELILDAPDAATIDRANPGRAYLRAGMTLTCFQVASVHESDAVGTQVDALADWRRPALTRGPPAGPDPLTRIVARIAVAATSSGRSCAPSPWLVALPDQLDLDEVVSGSAESIAIGRLDLPDEQAQRALELDTSGPTGVLIAGRSGAGRSGALITIAVATARTRSPRRLQIYAIDPSGTLVETLAPLPHVVTALGPDQVELAATLLRRLHGRVAAPATRADGADPTRLLLLLDSWDTLLGALDESEAAACIDAVEALLRIGSAAPLTIALAGGRALLAPRLAAGFSTRLVLDLYDRSDYSFAGIPPGALPVSFPPGRGVRVGDGAEFQLARVTPGAVLRVATDWAGAGEAVNAVRLRALPTHVAVAELAEVHGRVRLGVAGDDARPVAIDPFAGAGRLLVAGPPRSGRTTLLRTVLAQAVVPGTRVVVAAPARSLLAADAARLGVSVIAPTAQGIAVRPAGRTLLLVDDSEAFLDTVAGDQLCEWLRGEADVAAVVAGRCDDLATTYRGVGAEVRRERCGILLRPGPVDGEVLGVRLPRRRVDSRAGRGLVIGASSWGSPFDGGEPVPIQVAQPDADVVRPGGHSAAAL